MRILVPCLLLAVFAAPSAAEEPGHCSTFLFRTETDVFVGHNLDESPGMPVPGIVCVNKRGSYREGVTYYELIADPPDYERTLIPFADKPEPKLAWRSRYGSITFNSEGLDFPDGGINEAGLAIFEMSLGGTRHKVDPAHPTLFICHWIQHSLDTCATIDEVIRNAHEINQQGWSWHYFVSDRQGNFAIIEYLDGEVVVHTGDEATVPVLCNTRYDEELVRLENQRGFGAKLKSLVGKTPRFVRAARMLYAYDPEYSRSSREYALDILQEIGIPRWNKWAILIDVKNMTLYFHTDRNRRLRHVSFTDFDFGEGPDRLLDMHADLAGDTADDFVEYTYERNLAHSQRRADALFEDRFSGLIDNGVTARVYAKRFADYSARMRQEAGDGPAD